MSATDRFSSRGGRRGVDAMAAFTVLSWAAIFPLTRVCLQWFQPFELVTLRLVITAVVFAAGLLFVRPRLPSLPQLAVLSVCAFFGVALYNLFLSWGLVTLSAGAASFLTNTIPIFTALLSFAMNGERPTWRSIGGMLIAFAGIGVLASAQPGGFAFGSGVSFVLAGALCSALYIVLQRRLVHTFSPFETGAWLMILGAVFLLPFSGATLDAALSAPVPALLLVAVLAIVPGALGQLAWLYVLKTVPAGRAASLLFLIPPITTVIGVAMLGETVSAALLLGGGFAIVGVAVVHAERATRRARAD
ncbi:MAG: DMT family transporter [Mesorhizobium sp.]